MPISEERFAEVGKTIEMPTMLEYESWDMMIQVNGKFYCPKCYIAMFGNKEDKKKGMCSAQSFNKLF